MVYVKMNKETEIEKIAWGRNVNIEKPEKASSWKESLDKFKENWEEASKNLVGDEENTDDEAYEKLFGKSGDIFGMDKLK